jgi:hypothetical protein
METNLAPGHPGKNHGGSGGRTRLLHGREVQPASRKPLWSTEAEVNGTGPDGAPGAHLQSMEGKKGRKRDQLRRQRSIQWRPQGKVGAETTGEGDTGRGNQVGRGLLLRPHSISGGEWEGIRGKGPPAGRATTRLSTLTNPVSLLQRGPG